MTPARRRIFLAALAALVQAVLLFAIIAPAHLRGEERGVDDPGDVGVYFEASSKILAGAIPYRDFPLEYPPAAVPLMLLPRLFTGNLLHYRLAIALELLAINALILQLVACWVDRREGPEAVPMRLLWYSLLFLIQATWALTRLDLAVAFLAFAAAVAWFGGRPILGGATAALGVLLKVSPGAVVVPALAQEVIQVKKSKVLGLCTFSFLIAIGVTAWLFAGTVSGVRSSFSYHADRGLEVETIYAGVLLAIGKLRGTPLPIVFSHGSFNLRTPAASLAASASVMVQAAGLLLVAWRFARTGLTDGLRFAGASVLILFLTAKVLSPQYLLWILPFAVALEGRTGVRVRILYLASCLLTLFVYPLRFYPLVFHLDGMAIVLLNLRNVALILLALVWLFSREPAAALPCSVPNAS